jgi:hypothetical protein
MTQRDDAYFNFIDLCESLALIYCLKTSNPHHDTIDFSTDRTFSANGTVAQV